MRASGMRHSPRRQGEVARRGGRASRVVTVLIQMEADARKVGVSQTIIETRNYRRRTDRRMKKWMTHNIIHKRTFQNIWNSKRMARKFSRRPSSRPSSGSRLWLPRTPRSAGGCSVHRPAGLKLCTANMCGHVCYPWILGSFAHGPNVVALDPIDRQGLLDVAFFM